MQYQQKRKYSRTVSLAAYIALLAYFVISTLAHLCRNWQYRYHWH